MQLSIMLECQTGLTWPRWMQLTHAIETLGFSNTVARLQGVERSESEADVDFRYGQEYKTPDEIRAGRVSAWPD